MTLLYRMAADESDTGRLTLWTTDPDSAQTLAEWEAAPARPSGLRALSKPMSLSQTRVVGI